MAEVASIARVTQIGAETTPGVAVPATKRLRSLSFELQPQAEVQTFKAQGSALVGVTALGKEWTTFPITGKATYDEPTFLLDSVLRKATPESLGGSPAAYRRVWQQLASTDDNPQTYTLEKGSKVRAQRATYGIVTEAGLTMNRSTIDVSGNGMAQVMEDGIQMSTNEVQRITVTGSPSGGTFTLTLNGQTTAAIAYNANAAAVQSALEALSNVTPGDVICTGGALPATPVDVEFRGSLRQADITSMTADDALLSGGTSPEVTISTPTPGATPTAIDLIPILPRHVGIFLDEEVGDLGTGRLHRTLAAAFNISGRYGSVWPLNDEVESYDSHVVTDPTFEFKLTMANDDEGARLLDQLRLGSTQYLRIRATGPLISGSNYNRLTIDAACQVSAAPSPGDTDGVYTYEWTLVPVDDPSFGKGFEVELINKLASV